MGREIEEALLRMLDECVYHSVELTRNLVHIKDLVREHNKDNFSASGEVKYVFSKGEPITIRNLKGEFITVPHVENIREGMIIKLFPDEKIALLVKSVVEKEGVVEIKGIITP